MRLVSLTVRNYRLHSDIKVDFDPARNLIGGPNETGKSTLAEAIHRALFFRHRSGGEPQRAMKSAIHHGHPEVTLVFEAAGAVWTLDKRFSGTNGTARLSSDNGTALQGDAAEEQLAKLIGNPAGTVTTINQLSNQWSHLWVWQGTSGDDATAHAASHKDELIQRLQDQGLAAVMQSDTDERAREKIRLLHEETFTTTGAVKAGSKLLLAEKALAAAETALAAALSQQQRLESAITDQAAAAKTLADSTTALPGCRTQLAAANVARARVSELRARAENEQLVHQNAVATRETLVKTDQQIVGLRQQAAAASAKLGPAEAKLAVLVEQESTAREASTAAEAAHRSVSDAVRLDRQLHDLASACVSSFEKSATLEALAAKAQQAAAIETELAATRESLSQLPPITTVQLETLRKLETKISQAEGALTAIATGIELVSADQAVLLDGQPLAPGQPRVITGSAELTLGAGTLLRIQPGGGTSLADSRRKLDELRRTLTTTLDQLTVRDSAEAAETVARRQALEQTVTTITSRLQTLGARELPADLATATAAHTAATAEVDRRRGKLPTAQVPSRPASLDAARSLQAQTGNALAASEAKEGTLLAEADALRASHRKKLTALDTQRQALEAGRKQLAELENSARILEQNHGDATTRAAALATAQAGEATATATLEATRAALAGLDPELLDQTVDRLTRVITVEEGKQRDAETRIAVARNTLALDGSADPAAEILQARARHATAVDAQAREKRHADASALLHRLFSESQTAINESVTQPIADRVSGYLECLFGRGVRVSVDLSAAGGASLQLTRPGQSSFSFNSLSGGAKEQVAAAVRLATAEILAANHNGCLPVLFDDAFAFADPVRVQALQAMLDLAATRGLQVIVLTCTPADYIGLGARATLLSSGEPIHPAEGVDDPNIKKT